MKTGALFATAFIVSEFLVEAQQDFEGRAAGRDLTDMQAEQLIFGDEPRGRALKKQEKRRSSKKSSRELSDDSDDEDSDDEGRVEDPCAEERERFES